MNKEMKKWVRKEFPQKAERIIRNSLSQSKIEAAGIKLRKKEIFTKIPGYSDYYGSNYGRAISMKSGVPVLMAQPTDSKGYIVYSFSKPGLKRKGKKIGKGSVDTCTAHALVGICFLPDYWQEMKKTKEVHHLDHSRKNCKWVNLCLCTHSLHIQLNRIEKIWFYSGGKFRKRTPYQIQRQTDMTLEDIILPLKRECDMESQMDGHKILIYDLGGYFIGFQLTEAAMQKMEQKLKK